MFTEQDWLWCEREEGEYDHTPLNTTTQGIRFSRSKTRWNELSCFFNYAIRSYELLKEQFRQKLCHYLLTSMSCMPQKSNISCSLSHNESGWKTRIQRVKKHNKTSPYDSSLLKSCDRFVWGKDWQWSHYSMKTIRILLDICSQHSFPLFWKTFECINNDGIFIVKFVNP